MNRSPDGVVASLGALAALLQADGGLPPAIVPSPDARRDAAAGAELERASAGGCARGEEAPGDPGPAQLVARGPRGGEHAREYELLMEAIYEGYLVHYRRSRLIRTGDADLALLAGDRLYAMGLARLIELGDIEAVAELADVISLCATAHGARQPELAEAVWAAGARAVGWGPAPGHARAKELARAGAPEALGALRAASGDA